MANFTIRALLDLPDENTPQDSRHQSPARTIDLVSAPASPQSIICLSSDSDDDDEIVFLEQVGMISKCIYMHVDYYTNHVLSLAGQ